MPKIDAQGNATAYGMEGIVENAEGGLSELDPSRNVDGSTVDGFESDERPYLKDEEREVAGPDDQPGVQQETLERMEADRERAANAPLTPGAGPAEDDKEAAPSSRGSNSATTRANRATKPDRK